MYPDTDLPPTRITEDRLKKFRLNLPEHFWDREKWYRELGIPEDTIRELSISKFAKLFKFVVEEWKIDSTFAAVALIQFPKRLSKNGTAISLLDEEIMREIFCSFKEGLLSRSGVLIAMKKQPKGKILSGLLPKPVTAKELEEIISETNNELSKVKLLNNEKRKKFCLDL